MDMVGDRRMTINLIALQKVYNTEEIVVKNGTYFQLNGQGLDDEWQTLDVLTSEQKQIYDQGVIDYDGDQVRIKRNAKLSQTDWTQSEDIPQEIRDLWKPYRQALRDVSSQPGFPYDITWPIPPQ